jgi:hypothetical protein
MTYLIRSITLAIFLSLSSIGVAFASDWIAGKVRQPAKFTIDKKNWTTIARGMKIPDVSWIYTGKSGRLVLKRGKETIQFKPKTMAAIAKRNKSGSKTLVVQQFGELLLDVETRKRKHLKVETPFLAAVVKGTTFSVKVNSRSTNLAVQKGVVEVTDERRGLQTNVNSGPATELCRSFNSVLCAKGE